MKAITFAPSYIARGFSPIPLLQNGKHLPGYAGVPMTGWSDYCDKQATETEARRWASVDPNAGLALAMGFNDVAGIDVDDAMAFPATREIFGHLRPPSKIGSKGATAFFYAPGIESKVFRGKRKPDGTPGDVLCEVLAKGRCCTIPPSPHRKTGRLYTWHNESLEGLRFDELPLLTQAMIDSYELALSPLLEPKRAVAAAKVAVRAMDINERMRRRYEGNAKIVLDAEVRKNLTASKGSRGRQLFNSICAVGRYVHAGILDVNAVTASLVDASKHNGLLRENGLKDLMRTIQAGLEYSQADQLPELRERARA